MKLLFRNFDIIWSSKTEKHPNLGQILIFIEDMSQETQGSGNISKRPEGPADILFTQWFFLL
jgi:hypothetical protein